MSFLVVGYYTVGTLYEQEACRLITSLRRFNIPYFIQPIEKMDSWYSATQYKPQFLLDMLDRFEGTSLVYVDVDAEFQAPPVLFDELDARSDVHIGVHLLDHVKRGRPQAQFEMLSGTIFLKNDTIVREIVERWKIKCEEGGTIWDQVALKTVLRGIPYYVLPEEYCTIFDYMCDVVNPVIKHFQASRRAKGNLKTPFPTYEGTPKPQPYLAPPNRANGPRRVSKGGLVRHPRKWRH